MLDNLSKISHTLFFFIIIQAFLQIGQCELVQKWGKSIEVWNLLLQIRHKHSIGRLIEFQLINNITPARSQTQLSKCEEIVSVEIKVVCLTQLYKNGMQFSIEYKIIERVVARNSFELVITCKAVKVFL